VAPDTNGKEPEMTRKLVFGAALLVTIGAAAAGIAVASGGDDDQRLTGATLERATAAALRHTGGGTVTEAEAGDDGAAYEVEVRLPNGGQVEVRLDESFAVLGQAADDDGKADEDGAVDDG
jgi:uncharacterized membrane protein YkoI